MATDSLVGGVVVDTNEAKCPTEGPHSGKDAAKASESRLAWMFRTEAWGVGSGGQAAVSLARVLLGPVREGGRRRPPPSVCLPAPNAA